MSEIKLDNIDKEILKILQANGKITNAQLSKEIGLSPAPTLERVKKLENAGVIESYHAKINANAIGLGVSTFVQISLTTYNKDSIETFLREVDKIDEVMECHHITGSGDFMLKVVARDIASYQRIMLNKVNEIQGVENMQSLIILSTFKDSKVLTIPTE